MDKKRTSPIGLGAPERAYHTFDYASEFLKSLDTRVSRNARKLLRDGQHLSLISLECDPTRYANPDLFKRDWQAVNLLSKCPELDLNIDTRQVALDSFIEGERVCEATNRRLTSQYATPTTGVSAESCIFAARLKIAALLGDFSWHSAEKHFGFSSGASTRLRREQGDPIYKFEGRPHVTRRAALAGVCVIQSSQIWSAEMCKRFGVDPRNWVDIVEGSRIATVAKNAKTDRVIAVEPCLNMYLQRGIGGVIRNRLKRVGINLDDQGRNQRLAYKGSTDGSLATIDLKAASDTISTELVRLLLPRDWFEAMDLVRCEYGILADQDGSRKIRFEKFSSMGNGFTFELESLIFWALSSSVVDLCGGNASTVAVYGDDIIVPTAAAGWLIELLLHCGFTTNDKKSFISGPFRESCGKHYFRGVDVTPIYIRKPIIGLPRKYWVINSIRHWADRDNLGVCDGRYFGLWSKFVSWLPERHRRLVPDGMGDIGVVSTFAEAAPRLCKETALWSFRGFRVVNGYTVDVSDLTSARLRLYSTRATIRASWPPLVGDSCEMTTVIRKRDKVTSTRFVDYLTIQWHDPGIWVA